MSLTLTTDTEVTVAPALPPAASTAKAARAVAAITFTGPWNTLVAETLVGLRMALPLRSSIRRCLPAWSRSVHEGAGASGGFRLRTERRRKYPMSHDESQ